MEEKNRIDTSISGSGTISGGYYNDVKISGAGKVKGDLDCKNFKVSGTGSAEGNVVASEEIKISGAGSITGSVTATEFKGSGSFKLEGPVKTKFFKSSGTGKVVQSIESDEMKVSGYIKVGGDVEVDYFRSSGAFTIEGLLNAEKVDIRLSGGVGSKCQEIGGRRIYVRCINETSFLFKLFSPRQGSLEVTSIEGDDIDLEYTIAKKVCGDQVVIGEGCEIEEVEYRKSIRISENAKVGKVIQLSETAQEEELSFEKE